MLKFGRPGEVDEESEISKMWSKSFNPVRPFCHPIVSIFLSDRVCLVFRALSKGRWGCRPGDRDAKIVLGFFVTVYWLADCA